MNKILKKIIFSLIGCFSILTANSQGHWELKKDKDGIQVYIMKDDTSEFNPYKSVVNIESSLSEFEAFIKDSPRMTEWSESVISVDILEEKGDSVQIYYSIADAPFPIKNRDGIYQNSFSYLDGGNILRIDVKLLPEFKEKNKDCERVSGWGYWQARDLGQGQIEIICEMHIHPGGSIPSWLANAFADENPYKNMMEIRKILEQN